MAPHGEPEFLRHLGAEALSVVHGVLATVPAELQDGHHDGEGEAAQQHHEHSANVLDTERVGLRVLALVLQTENSQTAARRSGNTDKTNRSERGGGGPINPPTNSSLLCNTLLHSALSVKMKMSCIGLIAFGQKTSHYSF